MMTNKNDSFFFRIWEPLHHDFQCILLAAFLLVASLLVFAGGAGLFDSIEGAQEVRKLELQNEQIKLQKQ